MAENETKEQKSPNRIHFDQQRDHYLPTLIRKNIPDYMHDGIVGYLSLGIEPGSFLSAVIANDLSRAAENADGTNRVLLWDYVNWFYNHAPSESWGSLAKMEQWMSDRKKEREQRGNTANQ